MKYRIVNSIRSSKKPLLFSSALIVTFYYLNYSDLQLTNTENEADQLKTDLNIKVYKLSEKKELLINSTTGLVYPLKLSTTEGAERLVPEILHFIWIGRQVKEEYLENIITWRRNNPTYQVVRVSSVRNIDIVTCYNKHHSSKVKTR